MKYNILLLLTLIGCATDAQIIPKKPTGEEMLSSLLEASNQDLSKEPLCNMESMSLVTKPYMLKHHLSAILATSYENKNSTEIQSSCNSSKHEKSNGSIIDIWDCQLITNERSSSGEIITASTVAFGLDKINLKYVPQSLRCF